MVLGTNFFFFLNQAQCVWEIISTCSLRVFLPFLAGVTEPALAVTLKFCFHLERDSEIFQSKQFLKWNQRSGNTVANMYMRTDVGYMKGLLMHSQSYFNWRLMRLMFCTLSKSTKVSGLGTNTKEIFLTCRRKPTTHFFLLTLVCCYSSWPKPIICFNPTQFNSISSIFCSQFCG